MGFPEDGGAVGEVIAAKAVGLAVGEVEVDGTGH